MNAGALTDETGAQTFIHRQTLANQMRFTTAELSELASKIADAAAGALQLELAQFDRLRQLVIDGARDLQQAANALAALDVFAALAEIAEEQGYCRPEIKDNLDLEIVDGRHPVVEQMIQKQGEKFVPNSLLLSPPDNQSHGQIWLLTGPNMAGKSTFLRQNALIVLMAQAGSFVPAKSAVIGLVDRMFSRVGAADDLARGRSTFMVEMVETAAILNQATAKSMVLLDEIGRGTSTYDGLSIAWSAIEYLHEVSNCRTLFATHYHELTALSERFARVHNATVTVKEWKGDVIFLHQIAPGSADRSYGIQVAKLAGLPPTVIERAKQVLENLEANQQTGSPDALLNDLPLFARPINRASPHVAEAEDALRARLASINADDLSPKQALEVLYQLKELQEKVD
jgi:DNA mismatch repair protein MutS